MAGSALSLDCQLLSGRSWRLDGTSAALTELIMTWTEKGGTRPGELSGGSKEWETKTLMLSACPSCRKQCTESQGNLCDVGATSFEGPSFFNINVNSLGTHLQGKGTLLPLSSPTLNLIAMGHLLLEPSSCFDPASVGHRPDPKL